MHVNTNIFNVIHRVLLWFGGCLLTTTNYHQRGALLLSVALKECDRNCLIGIMDGYMTAIFKHDPKAVPPLAMDVRMTENTGAMDVGEGVLWRSKVKS
jgi:hypothetical protein